MRVDFDAENLKTLAYVLGISLFVVFYRPGQRARQGRSPHVSSVAIGYIPTEIDLAQQRFV